MLFRSLICCGADANQNTAPHPRRNRSGSIPHDDATTNRLPQRQPSFSLVHGQQRSRSSRSARFPVLRCANPVARHAASYCSLACSSKTRRKPVTALSPREPPRRSRRREIPIARGTLVVPPAAAISCLGAFQPPAATACGKFCDHRRLKTCTGAVVTNLAYTSRV